MWSGDTLPHNLFFSTRSLSSKIAEEPVLSVRLHSGRGQAEHDAGDPQWRADVPEKK
jgi:hypothetical protein